MRNVLTLLLVSCFAFAGCNGSTNGTNPPAPAPVPGLSVTTQRLVAQAAISTAEGIHIVSLFTAALADIQGVLSGKVPPPDGTCKNGIEKTVVMTSPTSLKATVTVFYDVACTQKLSHAVFTAVLTLGTNPPIKVGVVGNVTIYTPRGAAVAFGSLTNTTTQSSSGVTRSISSGTFSNKPKGGAVLAFGMTCTYSKTNTCGFAGILPVSSSESFGVSALLSGFTGNGTVKDGTASISAYTGSGGGLKIAQGTGDRWKVNGGTRTISATGTFDETVNQKTLDVNGTLAMEEASKNAKATLSFGTRSGIKNGHVTSINPPTPFASFSTDETGTGAIAYSQGPAARIILFIITN
jgi:hypothetical protein